MPVETFRSPVAGPVAPPASPAEAAPLPAELARPIEPVPAEPVPPLHASTVPTAPFRPAENTRQHLQRVGQLLASAQRTESSQPAQPRPRPKTRQEPEKKTLREILGLKPRKKLNWWQRIHWSLKASIPVILVAVVFALLKITILAVIFGILGAFLLIRGLKKEFKVRRPWF